MAWIAANFVGKPILAIRDARLDALKVAEYYWGVPPSAGDSMRSIAVAELQKAANTLMGYDREHSLAKRLLCRVCGYDLWVAARCLRSLIERPIGISDVSERHQKNLFNALCISLGTTRRLSADELAAAKSLIEEARTH